MKKQLYSFTLFFLAAVFVPCLFAQTRNTSALGSLPGKHRGAVNALLADESGRILSAGEDGFIEIWNNRAAEERFQLSPYKIASMILRPGKTEVAVIETDGIGLHRISAWNYETKENLFTLRFSDSVNYINYSAAGGFIIASISARTGVVFIHSETGETLNSPEGISGSLVFAATGRSERTMISYHSSGLLSYWDLESGEELQHFNVLPGIQSPTLFGNNRFLAGFDSQGLLILDAVTGRILANNNSIKRGFIFAEAPESSGFACLYPQGSTYTVARLEVDMSGRLRTISRRNLTSQLAGINCGVSVSNDSIAAGTEHGGIWLVSRNSARQMDSGNPVKILDIAASSRFIAFISEGGTLAFIPLDYSALGNSLSIILDDAMNNTAVTANFDASGTDTRSDFLLWQDGATIPVIKTITHEEPARQNNETPFQNRTYEISGAQRFLDKLPLRFPIRSTAILGSKILFLDTAGSICILDKESGEVTFTYSAPGAVDAAFIDENTIILGRSAVSGGTPFLSLDINTGETVLVTWPAMVGLRVYRGSGGNIFGAVIDQTGTGVRTSVIKLNMLNPAASESLFEYNGEDSGLSIAEAGGNPAAAIGDGAALLFHAMDGSTPPEGSMPPEIIQMERNTGLPAKIIDGGNWFIVLDSEGVISWHDRDTGEILADFRLYQGLWVLETDNTTSRGRTEKR